MEQWILAGKFDFLDLFLKLFFGSTELFSCLTTGLCMIGLWKMLEKSGIKGWWALIPGAREYQLARCAGREPEGRILAISIVFLRLVNVFGILPYVLFRNHGMNTETASLLGDIAQTAVGLVAIVYNIRVYSGLIEVYGVKRRWMWIWILPYMDTIAALV